MENIENIVSHAVPEKYQNAALVFALFAVLYCIYKLAKNAELDRAEIAALQREKAAQPDASFAYPTPQQIAELAARTATETVAKMAKAHDVPAPAEVAK